MVTPEVSVAPSGRVALSASSAGVLAYARGAPIVTSRLTWTDRAGAPLGVVGEPGAYSNVNLSRDDRRLAVSLTTGLPLNRDIWVIDLTRADTMSRRSFNAAVEADPVFSPTGDQIVYNSNRNRTLYNTLYLKSDDASGQETELVKMERLTDSPDWSHDGQTIVFTGGATGAPNDLWLLPLSGDRKPRVFVESTFAEDSPAFSPDDRRIAYNSDLTGRVEVYVRDVAGGREVRVSRDGGWSPRWRGDGKEMFFLGLDGTMMAVDIMLTAKGIEAGVPRPLFPTPLRRVFDRSPYAVTHDGKRFLFPVPAQRQTTIPLTVVVNWLSPPQR
jgi:Tol biopolymer transport system component